MLIESAKQSLYSDTVQLYFIYYRLSPPETKEIIISSVKNPHLFPLAIEEKDRKRKKGKAFIIKQSQISL